ncbi:MAG: hypothetical protein P1P89_09795 [Desulfobacterales bacterium]|nr:hypothetical protein [Desulfobacterales bacterium]
MRIPTYQIYNVLQQYTDKLTGVGSEGDENGDGRANPVDDAGFFASGKRREIFETITQTIKEKVSRVKLSGRQEGKNGTQPSADVNGSAIVKNGEFTPFVYNVIDKDHRKVKRTISVTRFSEP